MNKHRIGASTFLMICAVACTDRREPVGLAHDSSSVGIPHYKVFAALTPGLTPISTTWRASPVLASCGGFRDAQGHAWFEPAFDQSA